MQPLLQDVPSTLEFVMLLGKLIWPLAYAIPKQASGSIYIHLDHVPDSSNFKLKKQVDLTTVPTTELDSTTEEVEFW
jgi:hypothetical protein